MVGRENSPDSSNSGSVSRRTSRERSLSIASSLEDEAIGKAKTKTPEPSEDIVDQYTVEGLESLVIGDDEGHPGDDGRTDDLELDYSMSRQTSETEERSGKKSRKSSIASKSRKSSIMSVVDKSRSGSIIDMNLTDMLDNSELTTEIKQLETEQIEEDIKQTEIKSRKGSTISNKNKSRSGSIIDPDILDSAKNSTDIKQIEEDIKQTEIKSRKGSTISNKNKSRSGSVIDPDILDSSNNTTEIKQIEADRKQSRSASVISIKNKSRSGSILNAEEVEVLKHLDDPDNSITKTSSAMDIQDKTPEKKFQSDISTSRLDKSVSRTNSKKADKPKSNSNSSALINSNFDLSARDQERAKFAFSIYDVDGSGRIDGINIGHCLRALNLNPTNAIIQNLGGTFRKRERVFTFDEFLPLYAECKKNKNAGSFEDFMEVLKTYDKMEDGNVVLAELEYILLNLGERMEKSEVDAIFDDCIPEEDDEGCIEYEYFLRKLCEGFI